MVNIVWLKPKNPLFLGFFIELEKHLLLVTIGQTSYHFSYCLQCLLVNKDTRIQGYKNTRIQGYKDTRIQGYKDTSFACVLVESPSLVPRPLTLLRPSVLRVFSDRGVGIITENICKHSNLVLMFTMFPWGRRCNVIDIVCLASKEQIEIVYIVCIVCIV